MATLFAFVSPCPNSQLLAWQADVNSRSQQETKLLSTHLRAFSIPFHVDDKDGQFIEVQLYMSADQGRTWNFHSRQPTNAREFPFSAENDGQYWFAIKTLDRDRRLLPDGNARPELKINIDTKKPELAFQIQADAAGRVVCRWQAGDPGLDVASFSIRYRAAQGEVTPGKPIDDSWTTIPVQLQKPVESDRWADQLAWWPDTSARQLEVQIQIADFAGNIASLNRYIAVNSASWRKRSTGTTLGTPPPKSQGSVAIGNPQAQSAASAEASSASSNWRSKLKPINENGSGSRNVAANRSSEPAGNLTPEHTPTQQRQPSVSDSSERWRINNDGHPGPRHASAKVQIGEFDFVEPPKPAGWVEPGQIVEIAPDGNRKSVVWESNVHSEESAEREFAATTMQPLPQIAPGQGNQVPNQTDSIPSNPSTMIRKGNQVISESTTSWPDNQWNGPTTPLVKPDIALAPNASPTQTSIDRPKIDAATAPEIFGSEKPPFANAAFEKPQQRSVLTSKPPVVSPSQSAPTNSNSERMPQSANTQIISTKRFQLNYDINAVDPSGVGQIDLWMTRDLGQTWKLWGQDPDNVSPFPVEVIEEGVYGFRIVVRSKDGLAGRGPMRGDQADMWVQVDVTAPLVRINSVPYGRGNEVGSLVINYAVTDSNLTLRPNTLSWSTNPDGPWTTIEKDLRNEGRVVWKPARNVPRKIFLRLEATDRAGNVGVHNLPQAIDISGLIPRGTIFGVTPIGQ